MRGKEKKLTIYYDAKCSICRGAVSRLGISSEGPFEALDANVTELPENISIERALKDVHVMDKDGSVHAGADAILRILEEYPGGRILSFLGRLPVIKQTLQLVYRLIADNRHRDV